MLRLHDGALCSLNRRSRPDIEHLHLDLNILLFGGRYERREDLFRTGWDPELVWLLRNIHRLFPRLRSLSVRVENKGVECPRDDQGVHDPPLLYEVGGHFHPPDCPQFATYKRMEKKRHMLKILLLLAAVPGTSRFRSKTISFPFLKWPTPWKLETDCSHFWAVPTALYPAESRNKRPSLEQEVRVGLLFRAMESWTGGDPKLENLGSSVWKNLTLRKIEWLAEIGVGARDCYILERLLRSAEVVLRLSC